MKSKPEELIDLCPKCGLEVFQFLPFIAEPKYKCVEPDCEWAGTEPRIERKPND